MPRPKTISRPISRAVPTALAALLALSAPAIATAATTGAEGGGGHAETRAPFQDHAGLKGTVAPFAAGAYLNGTVAELQGDMPFAAQQYLRALADAPDDKALWGQAFLASLLGGRPEAEALARGLPKDPAAALLRGDRALAAGHAAQAETFYGGAPDTALTRLLRPVMIAWAEQQAGRTDSALSGLNAAMQAGAPAALYAMQAGLVAELAGRMPDAGAFFSLAASGLRGADLVTAQDLAGFAARSGRPEAGQAMIRNLVVGIPALAPAEAGLDASLTVPTLRNAREGAARALLSVAMIVDQEVAHAEQGAPPHRFTGQALGPGRQTELMLLRLALDLQPDLAPARLFLADLLVNARQPDQALAALARIPQGAPLSPVARLREASLQAGKGDIKAARATLDAVIAAFPKQPQPQRALGDLLQDQKDYAGAAAAYGRAIALMPKLGPDDWSLLFAQAVAYDKASQWPRAEADLRHALALAPQQPFILNYLGYSMLVKPEAHGGATDPVAEARGLIQRALDAQPEDGAIRDSLGYAMLRQNDVPGAVHELERAAEQTPEDPTVNQHLGDAYWAAGRKVEATNQWRWALILHPEPEDEQALRRKLHDAGVTPDAIPAPGSGARADAGRGSVAR